MAHSNAVLLGESRLFRDGIRQMLAKSGISVIAEGQDVRDVAGTGDLPDGPELVIFHVASEDFAVSPAELIDDLCQHFPAAKLVLLADPSAKPVLPAYIQAGVSAVLLTEISGDMLERSLDLVLSDHRLFPADIMSSITGATRAENGNDHAVDDDRADEGNNHLALSPPLSRREYQVVRYLAIGLSNKTIARELNITEGTVKVHVKGLLRKVKAANRTQLAIWALRQANLMGMDSGRSASTGTRYAA
jgi:two-component system, NarL family, nitrate/nitrite response regulator NarL